MFVGIGENDGIIVEDSDAFNYAQDACFEALAEEVVKDAELVSGYNEIMNTSANAVEFESRLVEWFYSGNWIHKNKEKEKTLSNKIK